MDTIKAIKIAMITKGLKNIEVSKRMNLNASQFNNILARKDLKVNEAVIIADAIGYDVRMQLVDRETGKIIEVE